MQKLVRAVVGEVETNTSAAFAASHDLKVLDESTRREDGRRRPATRLGGRKAKPKTTVATAAAKKADSSAKSDNPPSKESA